MAVAVVVVLLACFAALRLFFAFTRALRDSSARSGAKIQTEKKKSRQHESDRDLYVSCYTSGPGNER